MTINVSQFKSNPEMLIGKWQFNDAVNAPPSAYPKKHGIRTRINTAINNAVLNSSKSAPTFPKSIEHSY